MHVAADRVATRLSLHVGFIHAAVFCVIEPLISSRSGVTGESGGTAPAFLI